MKILFQLPVTCCIFFLFLFSPASYTHAQVLTGTLLEKKIREYSKANIQEKTFLHTDKNRYLAGEILWFSAFNVDAQTSLPAAVSKVLYVELLGPNNKPLVQVKIALDNGTGNGSIFLPLTLETGNYVLRAYTSWMKNFSADLYFQKQLPVVNTLKVLPDFAAAKAPNVSIQFFPEGGNLVTGIAAKVAFKATDGAGKGIDFTGYLLNNQQDTVLVFHPHRFGMGHFLFTPQQGQLYKAVIRRADNSILQQDLPRAFPYGYTLQLQEEQGQIRVTVNGAASFGAVSEFFVMAQAAQQLLWLKKGTPNQNSFVLPVDSLREGITQFTVFNGAGQPVCERLFFKKPGGQEPLSLRMDREGFGKREKVAVALQTPDTVGHYSFAAFRADANDLDEENIKTWLWLSSELKGFIESPAYYFSDTASPEASDNLMLTQGWRRFNWTEVLQGQRPVIRYAPEYNGQVISGIVRDTRTGRPAPNVITYLSLPGTNIKFATSLSDAAGLVHFDVKDFYGPAGIFLQTKDTGTQVALLSPFSEQYSNLQPAAFQLADGRQRLTDQSIGMQVQNWFHGDSLKQFIVPQMDTLPFYGIPEARYEMDLYKRFPTIEEVLREYVREVNVRIRDGEKEMAILNYEGREVFDLPPLVLVDGIPIFDQKRIFSYDPLQLSRLDVVTKKFHSGHNSFDGIASFITYTGEHSNLQLDPKSVIIDYEGLQLQREFYAPAYDTEQQRNSRLPDLRELLHWQPKVALDEKGQSNLTFYTSDQPGNYLMVLQGLYKGTPVVQYRKFRVE